MKEMTHTAYMHNDTNTVSKWQNKKCKLLVTKETNEFEAIEEYN